MEKGLVHIYYGDGKGKTTAAIGLSVRAAGSGLRVFMAQFLKAKGTGEYAALKKTSLIELAPLPEKLKFFFRMNDTEKEQYKAFALSLLDSAFRSRADMIILDEVLDAVDLGLVPEKLLLDFIRSDERTAELILTGHTATSEIKAAADYVSFIKAEKHPYQRGVSARKGIEY